MNDTTNTTPSDAPNDHQLDFSTVGHILPCACGRLSECPRNAFLVGLISRDPMPTKENPLLVETDEQDYLVWVDPEQKIQTVEVPSFIRQLRAHMEAKAEGMTTSFLGALREAMVDGQNSAALEILSGPDGINFRRLQGDEIPAEIRDQMDSKDKEKKEENPDDPRLLELMKKHYEDAIASSKSALALVEYEIDAAVDARKTREALSHVRTQEVLQRHLQEGEALLAETLEKIKKLTSTGSPSTDGKDEVPPGTFMASDERPDDDAHPRREATEEVEVARNRLAPASQASSRGDSQPEDEDNPDRRQWAAGGQAPPASSPVPPLPPDQDWLNQG